MTEPVGWLRALVYDTDDAERLSAFWEAVLGVGVADVQEGWRQLEPDQGGVYLAFEPTDVAGPPEDGAPGAVRYRPDIEVEDMDVAQARVEALGGRLVAILHSAKEGESHRRMADPDGNEFTLVLPLPPELRRR